MESDDMLRQRLAIWIFGPIGAGKTRVLERLPLAHFRRVEQDTELEARLRVEELHADTTRYSEVERVRFTELRKEVIRKLWDQVPGWRESGENLCFETTGDKPHLFKEQLVAGRRCGYRSLGCALRTSLEVCLARNRRRERVLADAMVVASWEAFERYLGDGTYARIFQEDRLEVCSSGERGVEVVTDWMAG